MSDFKKWSDNTDDEKKDILFAKSVGKTIQIRVGDDTQWIKMRKDDWDFDGDVVYREKPEGEETTVTMYGGWSEGMQGEDQWGFGTHRYPVRDEYKFTFNAVDDTMPTGVFTNESGDRITVTRNKE